MEARGRFIVAKKRGQAVRKRILTGGEKGRGIGGLQVMGENDRADCASERGGG